MRDVDFPCGRSDEVENVRGLSTNFLLHLVTILSCQFECCMRTDNSWKKHVRVCYVRDQSRRAEGDWEIASCCQHENDHVFVR